MKYLLDFVEVDLANERQLNVEEMQCLAEKLLQESLHDYHEYEFEYREFEVCQDASAKFRLFQWIIFLSELNRKHFNQGLFEPLIISLVATSSKNRLLFAQGELAFDASKSFVKQLFSQSLYEVECTEETQLFVWKLVYIFGQYRDLRKSAFNEIFPDNRFKINLDWCKQVFQTAFCKYQRYEGIVSRVHELSLSELNQFMQIAAGYSARKICQYKNLVSRKFEFFLPIVSDNFFRGSDVLKKWYISAALAAQIGGNKQVLQEFCLSSKLFLHHPDDVMLDLTFWTSVLLWIDRNLTEFDRLDKVFDYIEFQRQSKGESFVMKGRTRHSLLRTIGRWHTNGILNQLSIKHTKWFGLEPKPLVNQIAFRNQKYEFVELLNTRALVLESEKLHHCVMTYQEDCLHGNCSIFSLRLLDKGQLIPLITMEVVFGNLIRQAKGLQNRDPTNEEWKIIEQWAAANQFEIEVNYNRNRRIWDE